MKVLVCGSRSWTDRAAITSRLSALPGEHEEVTVIQGGARGADRIAADEATTLGFTVLAFVADWDAYGKRAGILRNLQMLDAEPDLVIAFYDGASPGTRHTIEEARRRGIPVEVVHAVPWGASR